MFKRGRTSVEFSLLDSEDGIYNKKRKCSCCIFAIKLFSVLFVVFILTGSYYLYDFLSKEALIERDLYTGQVIIKRDIDMSKYSMGTPKFNTYLSWDDLANRTQKCVEIDKLGVGDRMLYTKIKTREGWPAFRYKINLNDLLNAQSVYIRAEDTYQYGEGNFTTPMLYTENRSDFPCVCTLLIGGESDRDSLKYTYKGADILHMFNPHIHESPTKKNYARAKISLPFVKTMEDPFWMSLPSRLNVSFHHIRDNNFVPTAIILVDPINIVNIINCISLNQVKQSASWNLKERI